MESLGVGTTSPPLPSLLRDQTQPGLFSRENEEAENKVWSPMASVELPHPSPLCCVTRFNQGYSLVRKKKQEQSLESLGVWTTSPPLPSLLQDQTQPGLFSREKEEAENKVWSPMASVELPHPSPPCCVTRFNQGYSLVRKKKQEQSLKSLGVWTTSPPLPSLLHDQTQPGLFSREKEEEGKKDWSPWKSGQLPKASPPCCVTRLNQGYSLVRRKKQGKKIGVPGSRDNFPTRPRPAA